MATGWELSPETVSAIASGCSALVSAAAVGFAVWIGLKPEKLQKQRETKRLLVADKLLEVEMRKLFVEATGAIGLAAYPEDRDEDAYLETIKGLHSPILKECLDAVDPYPEAAVLAMAEVYALADNLREKVEHLRVAKGEGQWAKRLCSEIHSCAENLRSAIERLRPLLIPDCQKLYGF